MANFKDTRVSEKRFYAIPAQALTTDGTTDGTLTIENTYCWKVGQIVNVVSATSTPRRLKIKAVLSETTFKVGPIDKPIYKFSDVSDLLFADTAMVELTDEASFNGGSAANRRPVIDLNEIQRQIYEEEPTVAMRTHSVDWLGRSYGKENPLPVQLSDGDINIGTVNAELEVQLSHQDNVPDAGDIADSVQIGDGSEILLINPDGSINVEAKIINVKTPKTIKINTTTVNTEQSYIFTAATKRFQFRVQDNAAKAIIAYGAGETITNGWDISRGTIYEEKDLDLSTGVTIYFQVNKANQVIQIVYWE